MRLAILLGPIVTLAIACSSTPSTSDGGGTDGSTDATADVYNPGDAAADSPLDAPSPDASEAGTDGGLVCLSGGNPINPVGAGTCQMPYVIDLSQAALGTVVSYAASGGADLQNFNGPCKAQFTGTGRDLVFRVDVPMSAKSLTVGVDAVGMANPRIGVFEDTSCGQPINACSDVGGAGMCEVVTAQKNGAGFFGMAPYVVVSEIMSSNQPLTVRFRANN